MIETRVLVCGGRDADIDPSIVDICISEIIEEFAEGEIEFVSGSAKGGDALGEQYAEDNGYSIVQFKPDWKKYGRAAGPIRNKQMVDYIQECDNPIVIAFWDGKSSGTRSTIKYAQDAGIDVHIIRYKNALQNVDSGIQLEDNQLVFNWKEDDPEDILPLVNQKVVKRTKNGHQFFYAFKANKGHDDWNEFISAFKHSSDIESLKKLTDQLASKLISQFNYFDCILYPKSSSDLNELMIESIQEISPFIEAYPVSKATPKDIQFDWELFNKNFNGTDEKYEQYVKKINYMMNKIHESDRFSMQHQVFGPLRKYIKGFLNVEDLDEALDDIVNSRAILVLDDIVTSGSTMMEIVNMLDDIGFEGDVVLFTILNNK